MGGLRNISASYRLVVFLIPIGSRYYELYRSRTRRRSRAALFSRAALEQEMILSVRLDLIMVS